MPAPSKPAAGSDGPPVPEMRHVVFPLEDVTIRESKSGDGSLHLAGHAAVFDKLSHDLGGFRERISRGAFSSVLDGDPDVHLVIGHDMKFPMARTRSKTLELREDPAGLRVWARLDPEISYVKDLARAMARGDVDQMSFAFTVPRGGDEWLIEGDDDDERVTRTIREIDGLFDVSVVAQGAYPQTDANLRGLLEAAIESGRLLREASTDDQQDVEPVTADEESEPQGDALASDEQRTTAPETAAGESREGDLGEETRVNQGLRDLKALARTETELAKRRHLEAAR